jgi:glycerate kinase
MPARLLVAPDSFPGRLRAAEVAAAIGRGVERAGLEPPDLCPVASGGPGTAEVLLLGLGGETAGDVALLEDGGTAVVDAAPTPERTGERVAAAAATGAAVVVLAAGDDLAAAAAGAQAHPGLVVLHTSRRPPGDVPGARPVWGAQFVLEALELDERMRASGAVIVGEGRMAAASLEGPAAGEIAVRARQSGVPAHGVCAEHALTLFDQRILDLQHVIEAGTRDELEAAGVWLGRHL